jgi:DNA-binding response OmpR family regulator
MNKLPATNILIIEDDAVLRGAYETALTLEGYHTRTASDGEEGLAMAEQDEPDLILLDMLMPKLNGQEFLRRFDAPTKHQRTKIIVLSNMSVPSDVKDALYLGATKYLTKSSFTPKEIESIIQEVLTGD